MIINEIPKFTNEIFAILSKGKFISERGKNEKYYYEIKQGNNFEILKDYFAAIDYILEFEQGYFFFSKTNISEQDIERRLLQFEKYIDYLDLLNSMDNKPAICSKFSIAKLAVECEDTPRLNEKLRKINIEGKTNTEKIEKIVSELEKSGFVEIYDEVEKQYIVLDAFNYLNELIAKIKLTEDDRL